MTPRPIQKEELLEKLGKEDVLVLDVRETSDFFASKKMIKGAQRIEPHTIEAQLKHLPRDKEIVCYCSNFLQETSQKIADFLVDRGFSKVGYLEGGYNEWERNNFPVVNRLEIMEERVA